MSTIKSPNFVIWLTSSGDSVAVVCRRNIV